jgi:hypothetical protein
LSVGVAGGDQSNGNDSTTFTGAPHEEFIVNLEMAAVVGSKEQAFVLDLVGEETVADNAVDQNQVVETFEERRQMAPMEPCVGQVERPEFRLVLIEILQQTIGILTGPANHDVLRHGKLVDHDGWP